MLKDVSLDDKYTVNQGRIYLSGVQSLVKVPLVQSALDKAAGLNTKGFISGYRGSPLGGYDQALWQARGRLAAAGVTFQPGLNEDSAATALWGTQQVSLLPDRTVDGVFGIWYGKGPGLDRSIDAMRHASSAGASKHGGVLALVGDDHVAQSSLMAYQSEQTFAAMDMPVLNPATLQDYLDFAIFGIALSRFAGPWVGFKALAETVDGSRSIDVDIARYQFQTPPPEVYSESDLGIRWPIPPLDAERRNRNQRMRAISAFAQANSIDRTIISPAAARIGVIAAGKAYLDLREALDLLGLSLDNAAYLGIALRKIGLTWPLETASALEFARGLDEIFVVEEKRSFVEAQLADALAHSGEVRRPRLVGKRDESGAPLLPETGELSPHEIASALLNRLERAGIDTAPLHERLRSHSAGASVAATARRIPFMCSGCPHNSSTKVPEGSRAMAGTGCQAFALAIPERRTRLMTHMGGEGVQWIGQAPFTSETHVFQNMGDGTYTHSGLLAIRAACAAGVNITFKILYNDAVAMTGGQPAEGSLTVQQIAAQVLAEGVGRVVVVSDDVHKYVSAPPFPKEVTIRDRKELLTVQRELREVSGVTALIYDQTCAAEKRRRRKRGTLPESAQRVFINSDVCEACGDCSRVSNCMSVQPLPTELGIKRKISQSSCNTDFSCLDGFCPSFVTVEGGTPARKQTKSIGELSDARIPLPDVHHEPGRPHNVIITGIGGTGVVTVGALIGMAAHLEGKRCSVLDLTGVAQKNGAVTSHIRIADEQADVHATRIPDGMADSLIACDMVVALSPAVTSKLSAERTRAVANLNVDPTPEFVMNGIVDFTRAQGQEALRPLVQADQLASVDATSIAIAVAGDAVFANALLLGAAYQLGLLPLALESLRRAIELNGAGVEANLTMFTLGRLSIVDPSRVEALAGRTTTIGSAPLGLEALIADRISRLQDYQDRAYADHYSSVVDKVRQAEARVVANRSDLSTEVATQLFRLMSYKDEYEVARLYTRDSFRNALKATFDGDLKLKVHLAPPLLARKSRDTGLPVKRAYGRWIFPVFSLLAGMRRLRGTRLDIFGYTAERKEERKLIADYEARIDEIAANLSVDTYDLAVRIAAVPAIIKGFGHIKEANINEARILDGDLYHQWSVKAPRSVKRAAEPVPAE